MLLNWTRGIIAACHFSHTCSSISSGYLHDKLTVSMNEFSGMLCDSDYNWIIWWNNAYWSPRMTNSNKLQDTISWRRNRMKISFGEYSLWSAKFRKFSIYLIASIFSFWTNIFRFISKQTSNNSIIGISLDPKWNKFWTFIHDDIVPRQSQPKIDENVMNGIKKIPH